jgi:predicted TPR repeat methyltransferase
VAGPSQEDIDKVQRALERRVAVDPKLEQILAAEPRTALALARYGMQLANEGEGEAGCEMLEMAVLLQPEEPILWYGRGMVQGTAGAYRDAVESYRRALRFEPGLAQAWAGLAFALAQLEAHEDAAEAYGAALAIDPSQVRLRRDLGIVRLRQRRYEDAVRELRAAESQDRGDASLYSNLAVALFQSGAVKEAAAAYARVRALDPSLADIRENSAFVAFIDALLADSVDTAVTAYSIMAGVPRPDRRALYKAAIAYLVGQGWSESAASVAEAWAAMDPADPEPAFALKAASGDSAVRRAPGDYIVSLYDSFADSFDEKLVGELNYRIPDRLVAFIRPHLPPDAALDILDLGCGTGLSGVPLKALAKRLVGVDLSPRMIEKARARALYDALAVGEVLDYLGSHAAEFDLVTAADVVIYFGDLAPLFAGAAEALRPGGWFVLSAESCAGSGWTLLPSGRFAHSQPYLESLAPPAFALRASMPTHIRFEGKAEVPGAICLYQKIG